MPDIQWHEGQEVALLTDGHLKAIYTVERITLGGSPVVHRITWCKDGSERRSDYSWRVSRIRPATDEDRAEMERRKLALRVQQAVIGARDRLTTEQSRALLAMLGGEVK